MNALEIKYETRNFKQVTYINNTLDSLAEWFKSTKNVCYYVWLADLTIEDIIQIYKDNKPYETNSTKLQIKEVEHEFRDRSIAC